MGPGDEEAHPAPSGADVRRVRRVRERETSHAGKPRLHFGARRPPAGRGVDAGVTTHKDKLSSPLLLFAFVFFLR